MEKTIVLETGFPELFFDDLSFENGKEGGRLEDWKGERIQVRGFWYPLSDEQGILASHPFLKSCCLQAPGKIERQLFVKGEGVSHLSVQRALTLEGVFDIQPIYDLQGNTIQFFVLQEAKEISQGDRFITGWIVVLILAFLIVMIFNWRRKRLT
ncbi:MAG: hypothetical protein ACH350_04030 [Parachlamydiaceae bacterium]